MFFIQGKCQSVPWSRLDEVFVETAEKGNLDWLQCLLKSGANINATSWDGYSALIKASKEGNIDLIEFLIENGADINAKDSYGLTALMNAAFTGNLEVATLLIENGAETSTFCQTGSSLIHQAANKCALNKTSQNLQLVRVILESDRELVNSKAEYGLTPLHSAINSGRDDADLSLDLESLLIRFGADVNSLDDFQRTPLHYAFTTLENRNEASSTDPIQIASFLVEAMDHKAIDQRDIYGCSSLHYAAQRGATVCALLLLQKGMHNTIYLSICNIES